MADASNTYGVRRGAYTILVRKPHGKRPLERPKPRWEDIKLILRKLNGEAWTRFRWLRIETVVGAFVNATTNL